MQIFVSYAHEQKDVARSVVSTLEAAGIKCFLDEQALPPGLEYSSRIKTAVQRSDFFVFLASDESVEPGCYAMTELSFAEANWRNPAGFVLPVVLDGFDPAKLPAYLQPLTALRPQGKVDAEVLGWVQDRTSGSSAGIDPTPTERFEEWARLTPKPQRHIRRAPFNVWAQIVGGIIFAAFSVLVRGMASGAPDWAPREFHGVVGLATVVPLVIGAILFLLGIVRLVRAARQGADATPVYVLDRSEKSPGVTLHLQLMGGERCKCEATLATAESVFAGEMGFAWISAGMLLDFEATGARK